MSLESYTTAPYVSPDYVQEQQTIVFDPTASLPGNTQSQTFATISDPYISPSEAPFYHTNLIVTGIKLSNPNVTINLTPFIDFTFSPLYTKQSEATGLLIYSYILLTNYSQWESITVNYQAVGCERDSVLLYQIVELGNFDRTDLSIWESLTGDQNINSDEISPDVFTNSRTAFLFAKQINGLSSRLADTPNSEISTNQLLQTLTQKVNSLELRLQNVQNILTANSIT